MIAKEEIRIKNVIVHIMDATVGMPVLSDSELEYGSDFADFIREHIARNFWECYNRLLSCKEV